MQNIKHHNDPAMGVLGYDREELDFYPTEAWVTQALLHILANRYLEINKSIVWEPACGLGHMSQELMDIFPCVNTDIVNRGYEYQTDTLDFLNDDPDFDFDAIITNPPYGKMQDAFIKRALELTKPKQGVVAMLLRNEVDSAASRVSIFGQHPAFAEKVVLLKRPRWIEGSTGAPRHNYSWLLWNWKKKPEDKPILTYTK